jgi:hypothetical protein
MISWGRNFNTSSNPTKRRGVNLFNQTACRIDYDEADGGTLTFTNANLINLGIASYEFLPQQETRVATIFLTYKI